MVRYREKAADAIQYTGENFQQILLFLIHRAEDGNATMDIHHSLLYGKLNTHVHYRNRNNEGMLTEVGQWLVCRIGLDGKYALATLSDEDFKAKYEVVSE